VSGRLRCCLGGGGVSGRRGQRLGRGLGIEVGLEVTGIGLGGGLGRRRWLLGDGGTSYACEERESEKTE
jgi:hypothetical protein